MSLPLIGGLVGLAMAIVTYVVIGKVINKVQSDGGPQSTVRLLELARWSEFIVLPGALYFALSMIE
jgi:hypothetical protein